jgi:hypothetical protein
MVLWCGVVSEVADPDISSIQAAQLVSTVPPFPRKKEKTSGSLVYLSLHQNLVSSALFTLLAGI